jgi:hypothetical protein
MTSRPSGGASRHADGLFATDATIASTTLSSAPASASLSAERSGITTILKRESTAAAAVSKFCSGLPAAVWFEPRTSTVNPVMPAAMASRTSRSMFSICHVALVPTGTGRGRCRR